jgi:GT2 family glycosyltransferase
MAPKPPVALSVIICTCDRYDVLPEAIDSILAQTILIDFIIVDNSGNPARAAAFAERYRRRPIRYIYETLPNLSNARNVGTGLAHGKIVAFLDDDGLAAPDWAEELLHAFAQYPAAGCVGGRVVPRWLASRPDWLTNDLLGYLSLVDWGGRTREIRKGEWLAGCNIAYDRELLLAVGGFPRNLGRQGTGSNLLSNEELKVGERIKAAGKLIVFSPAAVVEHRIPAERLTKSWFLRRAAWQAISDYIAFGKRPMKILPFLRIIARDDFARETQEIYNTVLHRLHDQPGLVTRLTSERDFLKMVLQLHL